MPGGSAGGVGGSAQAVGAVALGGALLGLAAYGIAQLDDERKRQEAPDIQLSPVITGGAASSHESGGDSRLLVLWDIDDTMTRSAHKSGIAGGPLLQAVSDVVGRPISKQGCSFAGKTDTANVRALLTANKVEVDGPDARADIEHRVFQALPKIMEAGIAEGVFRYEALPGVKDLIAQLHSRSDVVQGLLTGNLEACCPVKLGAAGIDHSVFMVGAYGSDSADRNTLLPVAVSKYEALIGQTISPSQVVVIGDTPADVECAVTHGARCLAVASGSFTCKDLEATRATYCLKDLSGVQTVLGLLFDEGQYE